MRSEEKVNSEVGCTTSANSCLCTEGVGWTRARSWRWDCFFEFIAESSKHSSSTGDDMQGLMQ